MTQVIFYSAIFSLTFLLSAGASWAAWSLLSRLRPESASPAGSSAEAERAGSGILRQDVLSTLSFYASLLARFRYVEDLKKLLQEANLDWSVGRTSAMMLLAGALTFNLLLRLDFLPLAGTLVLSAAAATLPVFYIRRLRDRRLQRVEEQLPEALDYISRALVAGHSLPMSLELLAEEVGPPLSVELRKTVDEYNLGKSMEEALHSLGARLPSVDIQFFVSAIMTQARTGGNLHEILETLAETIRERASLKGQVRALTAHGRLTAVILSLLPFLLAVVMLIVNREYFMVLVDHPIGRILLFAALVGQGLAYLVINKIADIKV